MITIFLLLITFQAKHFLADYLLQTRYMLGKFKPGWDFALPLACHAGVHAVMTLCIVWYFDPAFWWLAVVDFVTHFGIDRLKAGPKYAGRWKSMVPGEAPTLEKLRSNRLFWSALGLDQMAHHCVHYWIIAVLLYHFN